MQLNKKYPLGTGEKIDLTGISKNYYLIIDTDGNTAELCTSKAVAQYFNETRYHGHAKVMTPKQAARMYSGQFIDNNIKLPKYAALLHIKLDEEMAAYVRTKPNITEYVRNLIISDIESNKVQNEKEWL